MNQKISCLLVLFLAAFSSTAQTISLEFPYFAGNTYQFKIVQGNKHVVLQDATIPEDGKVQLKIPAEYKGYKGMAMWYITNSPTGGGLELVINNEDFSVSLLDSIPTATNIIYKNTPENIFGKSAHKEQLSIFEKHDAMLAATRAYDKNTKQYRRFTKEHNRILKDYAQYVKKLKNSHLYAARFREIANITKGVGSIITQDEALKAANINTIIVDELDYENLYTSNFWGAVIGAWVQLHINVFDNDAQFIADTKTILKSISSDKIYTAFVGQLTKELTKAGKDSVIAGITPAIKKANKLENYEGFLSVYQKEIGSKAPDLVVISETENATAAPQETRTINLAKLEKSYSLLVFYQSDCGSCMDLMASLLDYHQELANNGIEIISIAADTDAQTFKEYAAQHPWTQKYCNLQGFKGVNFKNYAVLGTPTLFVVNKEGVIIKKMSNITELLLWSRSLKQ